MSIMQVQDTAKSSRRLYTPQMNLRRMILTLSQVWSWLFLTSTIIYFSIEGTGFFTLRNSQNILVFLVPIMLLGLGQTFVIVSGGIDLSVGWVMGLASVASARLMRDWALPTRPDIVSDFLKQTNHLGLSTDMTLILIGIVTAIGIAALAGFINGLLIAKLKIQAFIVTLGISFVARGLGWMWSEGNVVGGLPIPLRKLGNEAMIYYIRGENGGLYFFNKPDVSGKQLRMLDRVLHWPVVITLILVIIAIFVLRKTQFGRHTYAIGGNKEAALRAGVHVDRQIMLLYTLSGITAGIAGFLYNAKYWGGAADAGEALLMMSIAAVVIGGASMFGGEGRITGTIVGALIMAVLQAGLIMTETDTFWQYVIVGIVIIVSVLIDQARDFIVGRAEMEQVS
jgi:ribose transport system permease protein